MDSRIGIIGDGPTDRRVIGKLAECVVSYGRTHSTIPQVVELGRLNIRDAVDKYWQEASRSEDYQIAGEAGRNLQSKVVTRLWTAVEEFRTQAKGDSLSCMDVVVLSTDAEKHFSSPDMYFDNWARHLPKVLMAGIEQLQHRMIQWGYDWNAIPTIVPLPLYPSSEVIIAAARESGLPFHGRPAKELKKLLYNVQDLTRLSSEEFERQALDHLNTDALGRIFRYIPEARPFLHMLLQRS